jgi:hypothetical protein
MKQPLIRDVFSGGDHFLGLSAETHIPRRPGCLAKTFGGRGPNSLGRFRSFRRLGRFGILGRFPI